MSLLPLPGALLVILLLSACGTATETPPAGQGLAAVDFSGDWEVDYSESENIRDSFDVLLRELQRQAERQSRNMQQGGGTLSMAANSGNSLYALARMAEIITEPQLLAISQSETEITIKREGSFALYCEFFPGQLHRIESPLGSEVCGWDSHQLLFNIVLPGGLSIYHRLTLGPQGERLQIATTLRSDQVSWPFTVDRVYRRYDPSSSGIRCKQTLTRGKVCTTERPAQ
ncbi:hypothetical protein DWB85_05335 [Seongchinamella sediminis]|uniref:Uncharacterized protein n=1 Tax=Seongchinamella sediminis TaxID=2283635 RepID=A0A3L7E1K8_9GAMM|nr:hypothetical protein [Seongchinamella sediminis]RLQ22869.1 hypothetical protein DWB85_05335 [Seongchinamella sediminis]